LDEPPPRLTKSTKKLWIVLGVIALLLFVAYQVLQGFAGVFADGHKLGG